MRRRRIGSAITAFAVALGMAIPAASATAATLPQDSGSPAATAAAPAPEVSVTDDAAAAATTADDAAVPAPEADTPPTNLVCEAVAEGPVSTNLDAAGWTFSESGASGYHAYLDEGLRVWTVASANGNTASKSAGYRPVSFPLSELGNATMDYTKTSGVAPSLQVRISIDGIFAGTLVSEPESYEAGHWWSTRAIPGVSAGMGYAAYGTIDEILAGAYSQGKTIQVTAIGYSLGSGVIGDAVIHSITAGCTTYSFEPEALPVCEATPVTVESLDSWNEEWDDYLRGDSTAEMTLDGIHLELEGHVDGQPTPRAAGYHTIETTPLKNFSDLAIDVTGTEGAYQPAISLRVDLNGDGKADGNLTYEAAYNGNLWMTNGWDGFNLSAIPMNGPYYWGPLTTWVEAFPNATVQKVGYLVTNTTTDPIEFTIHSITAGCTTYDFGLVVPEALTVTPAQSNLEIGATQELTATITPEGAIQTVTWTTSDATVATVDDNGVVTAVSPGTATITASSTILDTVTGTATITVLPAPAGLTVTPPTATLDIGATQELTATITPEGATQTVTWTSSNVAIATVDEDGVVTATGAGTVTITATSTVNTALAGTATISVRPAPAGITVTPAAATLEIGAIQELTATVTPPGATQTVTWTTSDAAIATVDEDGVVTAVSAGTATITASSTILGTVTATATITVLPAPAGLTVTPETATLQVGDAQDLTATITPEGATQTVTWTTSDATIATVDQNGKVTAAGAGEVTITATSTINTGLTGTATITVLPAPAGLTVTPPTATLEIGATQELAATITPEGATQTVTWTSSNVAIATVDEDGVVTATGAGTVTITATSTGNTALAGTATITVRPAPAGITVSPAIATLQSGETQNLTATVAPTGATQTVTWSTSSSAIATVDQNGKVTAVSDGEVTITATSTVNPSLTGTATITVATCKQLDFTDVHAGLQHYQSILWLACEGISTGWEMKDGTHEFRPFNNITRDAMAAFLYRMAGEPAWTAPAVSPFRDVTPTNTEFYDEITWLANEEITTGWANISGLPSYKPFDPIQRDAMAAFLYRYADYIMDVDVASYTPPTAANSPFADITPTNTAFYRQITWLHYTGISTGWAAGTGQKPTFEPFDPITRDATAAFLYRLAHEVE